jgi:hypothetical protein
VRQPEGQDELHTTEILARALEETGDAGLAGMVERARAGEFHDFLSPHAFPEVTLMEELRAKGYSGLAQRVVNGDFDASPAESAAWGASPDGQATFAEATGGKLGTFAQDIVAGNVDPAAFWRRPPGGR